MCPCVRLHTHMCREPQSPEDDIRSPGVGMTNSCEPTGLGTQNQI